MSYATLERSQQSGAPVDLYEFRRKPADQGAQGEPAPFGDVVFEEPWDYATTADVYSPPETATWPATNVGGLAGGAPSGGTAGTFTMGGIFFGGGIGDGRGEVYHSHTITGLDPACLYRVAFRMVRNINTGPFLGGLRVKLSYETHIVYASGLDSWIIDYFRPGPDGEVTLEFGQFDLEYGNFNPPLDMTIYPIALEVDCEAEGTPAVPNRVVVKNYTSADKDFVYNGVLYTKAKIRREAFKAGNQSANKTEVEVAIASDEELAAFVGGPRLPAAPITCLIRRLHRGDLTDAVVPFRGQIIRVRRQDNAVIITLGPTRQLLERKQPQTLITGGCNLFLGSRRCGVNLADFTLVGATVTDVAPGGLTLTVDGAAAFSATKGTETLFSNGVVYLPSGEPLTILSQTGDVLTLLHAAPDLAVDDVVTLEAGCDYTSARCNDVFGNIVHHVGWDKLPTRNIYTGSGLS